nr:hypothetical protein [Tanacetum cinerariifolium]
MLVHQGEGSGTPTEPHHTPFLEAETSHLTTSSISLPSIPTTPIPPVTQPDPTPIRQYTRRARIAQSSALLTVADEPASPVRDVSEGEACPTDSGFIADQDRSTIGKSSTLPYDLAPRVTSPTVDEGSMQHNISELTALCTSLQREGNTAKQSGDDASIKGRSINEKEAVAERISNDSEEIARVLTSMDAATVLAGGIDVPTGSGSIPTASPPATIISTGSEVGPTDSPIVTRRKGKEVMVESDTPKKKQFQEQIDAQVSRELEEQQEKEDMRMNEQIARDAEVAMIHAEEELQGMIDSLDKSNETTTKYLQEYQEFALELPLEKRIELISDLVKYQEHYTKIENFIPMGSKEETERLKRKCLNLENEQVKKQKSSEEAPEIETSTKEFTEEKMKKMMQVELKRMYEPDPEDQLWTLTQNFMHAPVEWKLYDLSGVHHLTAKDREIFMLVEKDYPLKKGLALVMISYKLQVKCSHWQYKFPMPVKLVVISRRLEIPLLKVCTAIEEKKKKLPVKDRWQLH